MNTAAAAGSASSVSATSRQQHLPAWQVAALLLLISVLYFPVLTKLVQQWAKDPNFSHGFIVPLFSSFLVWRNSRKLAQIPYRPATVGVVVIFAALMILIFGVLGSELFAARSSLVILIGGLVIYFAGWRMFKALLFPWLFLFLMVPIPTLAFNQITLPLQFVASMSAAATLRLLGVPVLREGNIILLPSMPLQVAEACSGIRSLMSLVTIAVICGYLTNSKVWSRVALIIVAIPVAVAANAFRIVGTGLVVQYWDPAKAQGFFHEFSGWLVFVVSMIMLVGLQMLFSMRRSAVS